MPGTRRRGPTSPEGETVGTGFAPGHVTGVFAPRLGARDPRARGSIGAGLVLELGAHATARWRPGADRPVEVRARSGERLAISGDVAERVKGRRTGRLVVEVRHDLPVGQGFGMSAAGALATGSAVALAVGADPVQVPTIAHLADLFGGGGLGGVAAILGGGFELRRSPGVPPFGVVRRRPFPYPVVLANAGSPIPSPPLLRDPAFLRRVDEAARAELDDLERSRDPGAFLESAERFTDRLGLAPPALSKTIRRLRATGARVAQTMFGRAFFAVATDSRTRDRLLAELGRTRVSAVEVFVVPPSYETL